MQTGKITIFIKLTSHDEYVDGNKINSSLFISLCVDLER